MNLSFREISGSEVESVLTELGSLRIEVFREFPYLYEGTMAYEQGYLREHTLSARSLIVLLETENQQIVGASTCLPLSDSDPAFQEPFRTAGIPVETVFYLGESVILPAYRGHGAGAEFFRRRERHARSFGKEYDITSFCAVDRKKDHPLRPKTYRDLSAFWSRTGYNQRPELRCKLEWQEVGQPEPTEQSLTFWIKSWDVSPN